jgi:hypothetical protein
MVFSPMKFATAGAGDYNPKGYFSTIECSPIRKSSLVRILGEAKWRR